MGYRIFYGFIALLVISTGTVFAQEPLISIQTDDDHYDEKDTMVVSGTVSTLIGQTPIIIQIFHEGTMIDIAQVEVAQDGSFSKTFLTEGSWKNSGEYTVTVSYQEQQIEKIIMFSLDADPIVKKDRYEVDAGPYGTFDVNYTIKGATVKKMVVDSEIIALIVQIESTDERGEITLELPREYIGAETQDGKDDAFIIIIDGIEIRPVEAPVHSELRTITINFEQGDSDIEIIGTYIIPEFGAITMAILIVGIMMTVLVARNKFQISA